jgi:peptide/nickel transport system permease protein
MGSLRSFVITRLLLFIPMLWFLLSLVFVLLRVIPGANPVAVMNPQMPAEQVARITARLGLDKPLSEQYFDFLESAIRFDFGESYNTQAPVNTELGLVFGITLTLTISSILIGIPLGIYLGSRAGKNRENKKDQIIRIFNIAIYATPVFVIGIILQVITSNILPGFPLLGVMSPGNTGEFTHYTEIWIIDTILSGRLDLSLDIILHLILPSITLGMLIATSIARQVRTHMIHELEQDYVHFAMSRGIPQGIIVYKYAKKNAVIPVVGLIGLQFALLLSGAILTETVFNIPGLGRYLYNAIMNKDFPSTQGAVVIFTIVVSVVSLISDIIYALLDPRIKY